MQALRRLPTTLSVGRSGLRAATVARGLVGRNAHSSSNGGGSPRPPCTRGYSAALPRTGTGHPASGTHPHPHTHSHATTHSAQLTAGAAHVDVQATDVEGRPWRGIVPRTLAATTDGLRVTWEPDGHVSLYPWEWLHAHNYSARGAPLESLSGEFGRKRLWGAEVARSAPRFDYADVMGSDEVLMGYLQAIHDTGFAFIDNVPLDKADNERLARRIAYIRETLFGGFWDFSPNLEHGDTAYTTLALRAHTDGTYFNDPPGLQMFHCVQFNGTGGESLLVDGFRVASDVRRKKPALFDYLCKTRIPAHYQDVGVNMRALVPMINVDRASGNVVQIRYNGDDRDVLGCLPFDEVPVFYEALHEFNRALRDTEGEYRFRLHPNTVLIFDNWRVLHGRTAFTGDRRVLGCYINHDDYLSRLRTLREERGIFSEL